MNLPEELKGYEAAFRQEIEEQVGPSCVDSKCKVRVFKRDSDGDIQIRFTHYCGRRGTLTPL